MKKRLWLFLLLMIPVVSFFAGCGGGGSGVSQNTVSGVAAIGAPINGTVYLKDALAKEVSVVTNTDGSFSFNLDGLRAPYILKVQGTSGGNNYTLYSFCTGPGIANINPFANLATFTAAGSVDLATLYAAPSAATLQAISDNLARSITDIQTKLQPMLALYNAATVNPVSGAYIANHQGLDGLLDVISVNITAGTVTVKNTATGMTIFTAQVSDIPGGIMDATNIPMPPVVVMINPSSVTMTLNGTQTFFGSVSGSTNTQLTWSVVENGGGTITSSGLYTAPAIAGTYHVKATSVADPAKSATATITVTAAAGGSLPSGNSTMTVTVTSQSTGTTTKTYTGTYYTPDPTLFAECISSASMMLMNDSSSQLDLSVAGATPGTYTITDLDLTGMFYILHDSLTTPTIYSTSSGTIVLTAVGNTGEQITGTFQGTFYKVAPVVDPTNTLHISGTFSITRVF